MCHRDSLNFFLLSFFFFTISYYVFSYLLLFKKLGNFYPCCLIIFFSTTIFLLFFWDPNGMNAGSFLWSHWSLMFYFFLLYFLCVFTSGHFYHSVFEFIDPLFCPFHSAETIQWSFLLFCFIYISFLKSQFVSFNLLFSKPFPFEHV